MSIKGQGHFFTIYFPGFVCFVLYWAKISGERLQDHWSSGFIVVVIPGHNLGNSQVSVNRTIGPTLVFLILALKHKVDHGYS